MGVMVVTKYALSIYSWLVVGVLMLFLWRIARFYEKTSGQRVAHYLLVFPVVLLIAGVTWYLLHDVEFIENPAGNMLLFGGGLLLFMFGGHLQELMTGERR